MWSFAFHHDPLSPSDQIEKLSNEDCVLVTATANVKDFLASMNHGEGSLSSDTDLLEAFAEGGKAARVTLAHLISHIVVDSTPADMGGTTSTVPGLTCIIEPLHLMRRSSQHLQKLPRNRRHKLKRKNSCKKPSSLLPPYILERTDIYCDNENINITLAIIVQMEQEGNDQIGGNTYDFLQTSMLEYMSIITRSMPSSKMLLAHVGSTLLQDKIREKLPSLNGVAFLANGSIMPRKSGASFAPMASPPAIPFEAPNGSSMAQSIVVNLGKLCKYLENDNIAKDDETMEVTLKGLVVPKGITLIVGGGYHGKSTLLRAIMAGVYNKILGDGRELCVTDTSAVTVRAEDGRYVNNTNVSAFISNLPIVGSNTQRFSTREASGSTSQAANVSEAIEMGAKAMLVDEDVSAANFMSRDGRMRALVMDESITPLLYRVNGLYNKHGISSVVVVGGVGDWLDVPHAVIKLDRYVASDALEKARSISAQFSHGHVQYGGRGVVHRLPWDGDGTPCRRHPLDLEYLGDADRCRISLMDGGGKLSLTPGADDEEDEMWNDQESDEDVGIIDMARSEQLMGGKYQLYGCGVGVLWLMKNAKAKPELDMNQLLDELEDIMDRSGHGIMSILDSLCSGVTNKSLAYSSLVENVGYAYRPRRYEIFMALTRMRGVVFDELPTEIDEEDLRIKREAEERKRALAELWANRRKKK